MIELGVEINRLKPAQYFSQPCRDAHRQGAGCTRMNAYDLHVRDGAETAEQLRQRIVRQQQRVAA